MLLLRLAYRFFVLPEFVIFGVIETGVFDTFSELRLPRIVSVIGGRPVIVVLYELIVAFEGDRPRLVVAGYCK